MHRLALAPYPVDPVVADMEAPVFDEWHTLLLAVRTRLRDALDGWPQAAASQAGGTERSHAMALECVEALDQLHETLIDHGHRYRRLAFDLQEARAELALRMSHS